MYNDNKVIAIIPARGGSKGLPDKNILTCAGKPLISWTIDAALKSTAIDYVLVSTDSEEIARVAKEYGASVPYLRPASISQDDSSINDVVKHASQWVSQYTEMVFDAVIVLQPTSPLRTSADIDKAIKYYFTNRKSEKGTLVSVSVVDRKYGWLMRINDGYGNFCFNINVENPRRQNLGPLYLPNGVFFISSFCQFSGFYGRQVLLYEFEAERAVDVDTQDDLSLVEKKIKQGV